MAYRAMEGLRPPAALPLGPGGGARRSPFPAGPTPAAAGRPPPAGRFPEGRQKGGEARRGLPRRAGAALGGRGGEARRGEAPIRPPPAGAGTRPAGTETPGLPLGVGRRCGCGAGGTAVRRPRHAGRLGAADGAGRPLRLLHLPAAARHRVGPLEADAAGCHLPGGAADGKAALERRADHHRSPGGLGTGGGPRTALPGPEGDPARSPGGESPASGTSAPAAGAVAGCYRIPEEAEGERGSGAGLCWPGGERRRAGSARAARGFLLIRESERASSIVELVARLRFWVSRCRSY